MRAIDLARGKWRSVLTQLGIPDNLLDGKHHSCPNGEGKDRFRFADRNGSGNYFCACSSGTKGGIALLMCCQGLTYADAAKAIERVAGSASPEPQRLKRDPRKALNRIRGLLRPPGDDVARYLAGRGLSVPPGVRQARLAYWHDGQQLGVFESMVGLIQSPTGRPQSYHITYLRDGAKADVPAPRKVMTPVETVTGGAIRLYPAAEHMGVAEGIETAIAAHMLTGLPVWAAVTAHGVETFQPPPECKQLTVFGDADATYTGQAAAYALARRMALAGIKCEVRIPSAGDWADELNRSAA